MAIWSRLTHNKSPQEKSQSSRPVDMSSVPNSPELEKWLDSLTVVTADPLLDTALTESVDLSSMDRSGEKQLFSGRKIRLSTLVRDNTEGQPPATYNAVRTAPAPAEKGKGAFAQSLNNAKKIKKKATETLNEYGVETLYLAVGYAQGPGNKQSVTTSPEHEDFDISQIQIDDDHEAGSLGNSSVSSIKAPVLLLPVAISNKKDSKDIELQISGKAAFNPALLSWLAQQGLNVNADALLDLAYSFSWFDPSRTLEAFEEIGTNSKTFSLDRNVWIGSFADVSDNLLDPTITSQNELIENLANKNSSDTATRLEGIRFKKAEQEKFDALDFEHLDERPIEEEFLVVDADADKQKALDAAREGLSFTVSTPPGTGQLQLALNLMAQNAAQGKKTLIVSQRETDTNEIFEALDELSMAGLAINVASLEHDEYLRDKFINGVLSNEKAQEPNIKPLQKALNRYKHKLSDHVDSLHTVRERWGYSPVQAMQALAKLTALDQTPQTTVRLKRSVLDLLSDSKESREQVRENLERVAQLATLSEEISDSPWLGADLYNQQDVERALKLVNVLKIDIDAFSKKMGEVSQYARMKPAKTFDQWEEQLDLLTDIRKSLDSFTSDIYDRPLEDLIQATADSAWRREHDVDMSPMQRSRLKRVAKEYIRPGAHVEDLHEALLKIEEEREQWKEVALTKRHPSVPSGLTELSKALTRLSKQLDELNGILKSTPFSQDLKDLEADELVDYLTSLTMNEEVVEILPEYTLLLKTLHEKGFTELLADLTSRQVSEENVGNELDLAWWQSVLEAMISGDDFLAMSDGETLSRIEAEFRLADNSYISQGPDRVRWELSKLWSKRIHKHKDQARDLKAMLKDNSITTGTLWAKAPDLIAPVIPFWISSPYHVTTEIPAQKDAFDTLIILNAESVHNAAALPAIGRVSQVIALGDTRTGLAKELSFESSDPTKSQKKKAVTNPIVTKEEPNGQKTVQDPSILSDLESLLPRLALTSSYRFNNRELLEFLSYTFYDGNLNRLPDNGKITGNQPLFDIEYVENGVGLPTTDGDGVEAVAAEVNRVAQLVFEHARTKPDQSLAVITASDKTARSIAEAISVQMPNFPLAAEFFANQEEPFIVTDISKASDVIRDNVIFSLGFGQTPHGRVVHTFGELSSPQGSVLLGRALTRARDGLYVISALKPEMLDKNRLQNGARDFYNLLEAHRSRVQNFSWGQDLEEIDQEIDDPIQDTLITDLVSRLREFDIRAWKSYEDSMDIAAAYNPAFMHSSDLEAQIPISLESDANPKDPEMTIRERFRQRPELFERLGWRYMSLWAIDIFSDPQAVADRIAAYLGADSNKERKIAPLERVGSADDDVKANNFSDSQKSSQKQELKDSHKESTVSKEAEDISDSLDVKAAGISPSTSFHAPVIVDKSSGQTPPRASMAKSGVTKKKKPVQPAQQLPEALDYDKENSLENIPLLPEGQENSQQIPEAPDSSQTPLTPQDLADDTNKSAANNANNEQETDKTSEGSKKFADSEDVAPEKHEEIYEQLKNKSIDAKNLAQKPVIKVPKAQKNKNASRRDSLADPDADPESSVFDIDNAESKSQEVVEQFDENFETPVGAEKDKDTAISTDSGADKDIPAESNSSTSTDDVDAEPATGEFTLADLVREADRRLEEAEKAKQGKDFNYSDLSDEDFYRRSFGEDTGKSSSIFDEVLASQVGDTGNNDVAAENKGAEADPDPVSKAQMITEQARKEASSQAPNTGTYTISKVSKRDKKKKKEE